MSWQTFRLRALWCWHQLLTLALVLLVLVAVLVGVGRQLLPAVGDYRGHVEAELSTRIGLPVTLDGLTADWGGLGLNFHLLGLRLRDPADPAKTLLTIPEVSLHPAFWQSLRHLEPRLEVSLRGLDIHLDQLPDGRMQLRELASVARHDAGAAEQAMRFALRQPALALTESRVGLLLQRFPGLELSGIELVNRNEDERHRLAGRFLLPGSREPVQLNLEINGDPLDWQKGQLAVWLHLPVLRLDSWLPQADAASLRLLSVTGGGDYWIRFQRGQLQSLQTRLDWRDVVVQGKYGRHELRDMRGLLRWQRDGSGWQLGGSQLQGRVNDLAWPVPVLALRGGEGKLTVAAAHVDVTGTAHLLRYLPVPETVQAWVREAQPQGLLDGLRLELVQGEDEQWQPQLVEADIRSLGNQATATWPGARGLSGWLRWTPDQAWLGLDLKGSELDLRQVFREAVVVQRLQGRFRWRQDDSGWRLESDQVQLANADARGGASFRLFVPAGDPQAARLSLLASIEQARAASAWRYVPWPAAGDDTLAWLRQAITGGTVSQGHFLYDGPVHDRADLPPHRMQMRFALKGGRLHYHEGWPELRDVDAELEIDGRRLSVQGQQGRLLEATQGRALTALIEDLHQPVLTVGADLSSQGSDLMTLFRESPLKEHTGDLPDLLTLSGPVAGHLDLRLPLTGKMEPEVDVQALLHGNRLELPAAGLQAGNVEGEIRYSTRTGLTAPALSAMLLESQVQAQISSQMRRGDLQGVNVALQGRAEVPALRRWLGSNLLQLVSGGAAYEAQLSIPANAPVRLQLNSTLSGLRLDMPAPLGKSAGETVPLRYQTTLGSGEQMARLQYGQRLSGGLVWVGSRLDRALFRLDGNAAAWPQHAGIEVEGKLARLDLREWKPWVERLERLSPSGTVAAKGEAPLPSLTRMELETREIVGDGLRLQNARVSAGREAAAWRLGLSADEVEGSALLPDAPGSDIRITFSRLQWPLTGVEAPRSGVGTDPVGGLGNRPLAISGEGLKLTAMPGLGLVGLSARLLPSPYGLRIEDINVDSNVLDFQGRMDWQWRGGVRTRLRGTASSQNVAGVLSALGYAPSLVSPKAAAEFDLGWAGAPDSPQASALDGQLKLTVEQGRLLTISNTTSASRVFGWFDVDNLKRRFKGDFSDVLKKGLSFDKASLSGNLQGGVMNQALFSVDGPTLKADGQGKLDLGRQQMDQQFTVMVPVSSAVPVAAVVVAGPVVGGAVVAAQWAFGRQIDKVTQLRYHVSGDWANPKIERMNMKVFDLRPEKAAEGGSLQVNGSQVNGSKP